MTDGGRAGGRERGERRKGVGEEEREGREGRGKWKGRREEGGVYHDVFPTYTYVRTSLSGPRKCVWVFHLYSFDARGPV